MVYTQPLKKLIKEFEKLPGIGNKTAERLGFHILKISAEEALALAEAISMVKKNVKQCRICCNIADTDPCDICSNPKRNHAVICVVEQIKDLISLEKTGSYGGVYHVLMGRLAPLENQHPEDTTVKGLIARVKSGSPPIEEIIIATNPNIEGDTTALYIKDALHDSNVKVSRIARGIPSGGSIEFANQTMLTDALEGRQAM